MKLDRAVALLFIATMIPVAQISADEGMWLYNQFPKQMLKAKYGFEPSDEWLKHVRLSSVRFNSGGSGSFVSSNGLVMTNHHVGADALQKLSTADRDLVKSIYRAKSASEALYAGYVKNTGTTNLEVATAR